MYSYLCKESANPGGSHSSVVLSAPTIMQPQVRIPCTQSILFSTCVVKMEAVIDIGMIKERK